MLAFSFKLNCSDSCSMQGITFLKVSPSSPEYSTGSTLLTHLTVDKPDCIAADASDAYHVIVQ